MVLVVVGCSAFSNNLKTTTPNSETKQDGEELFLPIIATPEYISLIVPFVPQSISIENYNKSRNSDFILARGIAISIWVNRINISADNCHPEAIKQKVKLYIDQEEISNTTLLVSADGEVGCGLYRISWAPMLQPGQHEATFSIITDSGDILEYTWQFQLTK